VIRAHHRFANRVISLTSVFNASTGNVTPQVNADNPEYFIFSV
jgi:hypothetical protein